MCSAFMSLHSCRNLRVFWRQLAEEIRPEASARGAEGGGGSRSGRRAQPDEPPAEPLAAVQLEGVDSDEAEPQRLQSPPRLVRHREDPALLAVGLAEEQHGAVLAQ